MAAGQTSIFLLASSSLLARFSCGNLPSYFRSHIPSATKLIHRQIIRMENYGKAFNPRSRTEW